MTFPFCIYIYFFYTNVFTEIYNDNNRKIVPINKILIK